LTGAIDYIAACARILCGIGQKHQNKCSYSRHPAIGEPNAVEAKGAKDAEDAEDAEGPVDPVDPVEAQIPQKDSQLPPFLHVPFESSFGAFCVTFAASAFGCLAFCTTTE
jgi:hypothetical protein